MQVVADLHLHSKYSRAVSPNMTLPIMAQVAQQKGLDLLATGDWTHPLWLKEIRNYLTEAEEGIFTIKSGTNANGQNKNHVRFLLSVEISCIYSQGGKGRRIHNLVFAPSFETVEKINKELVKRGYNITADGRPIIGLSSKGLLELILEIDERCLLIPCHIWTPWFGLYGMSSGFMSIEECFEDLSPYIYGIETGLSSDPEMNWQIKELDTRSILSFSDAHSPAKMGREATVFELESLCYANMRQAIMRASLRQSDEQNANPESVSHTNKTRSLPHPNRQNDGKINDNKVLYTIEFYPEEGKYHYSGHRSCKITMTPEEQRNAKGICPVCNRRVTDGVMRRVQELANEDPRGKTIGNEKKLKWYTDPQGKHPPFVKIVPLLEIISEAVGMQVTSMKVKNVFDTLTKDVGSELDILLKLPLDNKKIAEKIAQGIQKVREGDISINPGYDGVYGTVKIWNEVVRMTKKEKTQLGMEF